MRNIIKSFVLAVVLLAIAGCATGYVSRGFSGGYSEDRIDASHYIVSFDGNGYASQDRVWYFWIYRCAQLTREKGFTYFTVGKNLYRKSSYDGETEGARLQPAVLTDRDMDRRTGAGHGYRFTDTAGGYIYIAPVRTWHSSAEVSMYKYDLPEQTLLLKAQSVLDELGAYVRSNGKAAAPSRLDVLERASYIVESDHRLVYLWSYLHKHSDALRVPPYLRAPGVLPPMPPPPPPPPPRSPPPPAAPNPPHGSGATQSI